MEYSCIHFNSIDSTNTWAKSNAHLLEIDRINLITANAQWAGRGRGKKQWLSSEKTNIYASFAVFIPKTHPELYNLGQVMCLTACEVMEYFGFSPQIKWPNDLLLSGKKVGGVLCELINTENSDMILAIIGIGLNVNMSSEVLNTISQPATSLMAEMGGGGRGGRDGRGVYLAGMGGRGVFDTEMCECGVDSCKNGMCGCRVDPCKEEICELKMNKSNVSKTLKSEMISLDKVLDQLKVQFNKNFTIFLRDGFPPYFNSFQGYLIHKRGDKIILHFGESAVAGFFQSINEDGSIFLKLESGEIKNYISGEIE